MKAVSMASVLALLGSSACAAPVLLDSSSLSFVASGSPNTIVGTWTGEALQLWSLDAVEYFTVELEAFESPFGAASSISFGNGLAGVRSGGLSFCGNPISCIGEISLGEPFTVGAGSLSSWNFVTSLVDGYYGFGGVTSSGVSISYSDGGSFTTATGQLRVSAWGAAQPVPTPSSLLLGLVGLSLLPISWALRNKKVRGRL